jgi:hypothetical protein
VSLIKGDGMLHILLRRKHKVLITSGDAKLPLNLLASALKNLDAYGYSVSSELLEVWSTYAVQDFCVMFSELTGVLKELKGDHIEHKPMYPNFPEQVMQASFAERFVNAYVHYLTNGDFLPEYEKETRIPLFVSSQRTELSVGGEDDLFNIVQKLLSAGTSISDRDKKDIEEIIEAYPENVDTMIPENFMYKEQLVYAAKLLLDKCPGKLNAVMPLFKNATDVLRLATGLSDGDISLSSHSKLRVFKRAERRLLLAMLNNMSNVLEDMQRHKQRWLRLGIALHPGDYANKYPKACQCFYDLRSNKKVATWGGMVEQGIADADEKRVLSLLEKRPTEFARMLDRIVRDDSFCCDTVLSSFNSVVGNVSTPVLLNMMCHFANRDVSGRLKAYFPKGNAAKVYVVEGSHEPLSQNIIDKVVFLCTSTLIERFKELEALGKVYIDPAMHKHVVPFSQRSASEMANTLVRGSRVPFDSDKKVFRSFIYWKGAHVDVDSSFVAYDAEWNKVDSISYCDAGFNRHKDMCHSGDITSAPKGATEFVDLYIDKLKARGIRYVAASVNMYRGPDFCDLKECFAGWMMRDGVSGEIYEPTTVENKFDIKSKSKICMPYVIDLEASEVVWTDLVMKHNTLHVNNIYGNAKGLNLYARIMAELNKPTLGTLFLLHAEARGVIVQDKDEADTVFSMTEGITPNDLEIIMSDFL